MAQLKARTVADKEKIIGRRSCILEPDCAGCHTDDFVRLDPAGSPAFNTDGPAGFSRMRKDESGLL